MAKNIRAYYFNYENSQKTDKFIRLLTINFLEKSIKLNPFLFRNYE